MIFIVSGHDQNDGLAQRLKFRPQHRAHYEGLGDDLILSGPFLDANGDPIGSMIIMRAENQDAAENHANADPYVIEGVFKTLTVERWDWFMKRPADLVT